MGNWQWVLDLVVAALLAATLLRARRLDRALSTLRQDRGSLQAMLGGFDESAKQARGGVDRLRELTEGAGRRIEQQTAAAIGVQDELAGLIERGERLAERLDHAVRAMRAVQGAAGVPASGEPARPVPVRAPAARAALPRPAPMAVMDAATGESGRVRSKAERDLLLALQGR